jgi:hypothetical protein
MGAGTALADALFEYISAIMPVMPQCVTPISPEKNHQSSEPDFAGLGFTFTTANANTAQQCTAVMVDIERLFTRVQRYTAQKSRFVSVQEGKNAAATTDTDLYRLSADEKELYLQFLREGAHRLWQLFYMHAKALNFRGFLFDEGYDIEDWEAENSYSTFTIVRADDKFYQAAYDNVPAGTQLDETQYWREVSVLYDTKGKVVFFVRVMADNPIPSNALLRLLTAVVEYLYAFVLWRWYVLASLPNEAQVWATEVESWRWEVVVALSERSRDVRLRPFPF